MTQTTTTAAKKLVLYTNRFCPFAARAVLAMAETKQPYEAVEIDLNKARPDWYLKEINPYGQVPALKIDDKSILLENLIVAEYLADLHPETGLMPNNPLQRAQSRYLIQHWGSRTQPAQQKAAFSLDTSNATQRHQDWIKELEKIDVLLRQAHRTPPTSTSAFSPSELQDGPYFLGKQFTFADLALASFLTRVPLVEYFQREKFGFVFPSAEDNPRLKRFIEWKDAVVSRQSVVESLPSKEELIKVYEKLLD
ncbi:hypothetical protein EDD11_006333 [Mortierella claussenii]|nr:hypothetical protein EDD11_006333 [Mortierella claussenii]